MASKVARSTIHVLARPAPGTSSSKSAATVRSTVAGARRSVTATVSPSAEVPARSRCSTTRRRSPAVHVGQRPSSPRGRTARRRPPCRRAGDLRSSRSPMFDRRGRASGRRVSTSGQRRPGRRPGRCRSRLRPTDRSRRRSRPGTTCRRLVDGGLGRRAARIVMKPTRATPIIRADAVAAVRLGLRRAFSRARCPVGAGHRRSGMPSTRMHGAGDHRAEHEHAEDASNGAEAEELQCPMHRRRRCRRRRRRRRQR